MGATVAPPSRTAAGAADVADAVPFAAAPGEVLTVATAARAAPRPPQKAPFEEVEVPLEEEKGGEGREDRGRGDRRGRGAVDNVALELALDPELLLCQVLEDARPIRGHRGLA